MIALACDCLLFKTASGESLPLSAEMISVELAGGPPTGFDDEFIRQASKAVFHYFKHDLGRETVTIGEFAGALDKVLRGFALSAAPRMLAPRVIESDLRELASESGKGCELFFFPRLRDEVRQQLQQAPRLLHFSGLRSCVKQLAGAQRWSSRCRTLQSQIVEYLRECLSLESKENDCALRVD